MKTLNLMFMLGFPLAVTAQNPIICDRYTPDPAPYLLIGEPHRLGGPRRDP